MFAESFGAGRGEFDLEKAEFDLVKKDDVYDRVIDNTSINAPAEPIIEGGSMLFCTENGKCTLKKNGTIVGNCFQNYDDSVVKFGKSMNFEMADEQIDRDKGDFINMDFKANISTDGNYSLGAEGRMCDEHGEEYIDFYMYPVLNYDAVPKEAKYLGSKEFANARFVRNLYERTWSKAALRCTMAGHTNIILTKQDFICASEEKEFNEKIDTKNKLGFKNSL